MNRINKLARDPNQQKIKDDRAEIRIDKCN